MHAAKVNSSVFVLLLVFRRTSRCSGRTLSVSFVLHNDEMESMCVCWVVNDARGHPTMHCNDQSDRNGENTCRMQLQQQHRRRYWLLLLLDFCERWYGHMMKTNSKLEPNRCLYVCSRWCNLNFKRIAARSSYVAFVEQKIIVGKSQHYANLNRSYCLIFWSQSKIE